MLCVKKISTIITSCEKERVRIVFDEMVIKLVKWAISIVVVLYIGVYGIYFGFYKLVNYVDDSIYIRYATENQFDWSVYFNEDVEEKTGIVSEINQITEIMELPQNSSKQAIYVCMRILIKLSM